MNDIQQVCSKEVVSYTGVVILTLEAINMASPRCHFPDERPFGAEVVSHHPHGVHSNVPEILGCCDHMYSLLQYLPGFILGQPVISLGKEDLDMHCALLALRCFYLC